MRNRTVQGYACTECGLIGPATIRNEGIGSYECHGTRGTDVQWVLLSKCCDAPVVNSLGIEQTPESVTPDDPEEYASFLRNDSTPDW